MATPQQPELRRSGHTPAEQGHAKELADSSRGTGTKRRSRRGPTALPPENEPGHHPPVEQDKPAGPPPTPATARDAEGPAVPAGRERFGFAFEARLFPAAAAFGVTPPTAHVDVDEAELHIRFGPWSLRTPLDNVRSLTPTGPYTWWKVAGPAHVSLADRGVTFATTTERGVCIGFREPVRAALPTSLVRHPAATVTVGDPDGLVAAISSRTTLDDSPSVGGETR